MHRPSSTRAGGRPGRLPDRIPARPGGAPRGRHPRRLLSRERGVPSSPATLPEALAVGALDATGRPPAGVRAGNVTLRRTRVPRPRGAGHRRADGRPDRRLADRERHVDRRSARGRGARAAPRAAPRPAAGRADGSRARDRRCAGRARCGRGRVDAVAAFEWRSPAPRDRIAPVFTAPGVSPAVASGATPSRCGRPSPTTSPARRWPARWPA